MHACSPFTDSWNIHISDMRILIICHAYCFYISVLLFIFRCKHLLCSSNYASYTNGDLRLLAHEYLLILEWTIALLLLALKIKHMINRNSSITWLYIHIHVIVIWINLLVCGQSLALMQSCTSKQKWTSILASIEEACVCQHAGCLGVGTGPTLKGPYTHWWETKLWVSRPIIISMLTIYVDLIYGRQELGAPSACLWIQVPQQPCITKGVVCITSHKKSTSTVAGVLHHACLSLLCWRFSLVSRKWLPLLWSRWGSVGD